MADSALEPTETVMQDKQADRASARRTWLIRLALAVLVVGLLWGVWYLLFGRNHVGTDNAYVNAETAQVTPLVSAQVVEVLVSDTQTVRKGDILAKLDPTNAQIAVAQAEADLAEARRRFRQTAATSESLAAQVSARGADIVQARAQLATAQAEYEKARVDLQRREALVDDGAVSGDEVTAARQAFASARAALEQARAGVETAQATRNAASGQYQANEALVRGATVETDPAVLAAKARLESARLDIARSIIRAPIGGVISRRQVQVGQRVAQGSAIMTIVPLDRLYVDANFKERQLRGVKIGMPAKVTSDLYGGDVVYHGRVVGFSGGTGSSMSLIPAQNATGNWIKVVQRLPLRIALDPKELAAHPLRVGLSMDVELDLSDR